MGPFLFGALIALGESPQPFLRAFPDTGFSDDRLRWRVHPIRQNDGSRDGYWRMPYFQWLCGLRHIHYQQQVVAR